MTLVRSAALAILAAVALALVPAGSALAAKKRPPAKGGKAKTELRAWLKGQVGPVKKQKKGSGRKGRARAKASKAPKPLDLVRSYEIPAGDPAAARLQNRSYTYDSALAAIALMAAGDRASATAVLDELADLQDKDGSLDFAYDAATGEGLGLFRTGAIAWVGLAVAQYRESYGNAKFDKLADGVAEFLLARRRPDGLLAGGPDVMWVSTQHNLLAHRFLVHWLATSKPSSKDAAPLQAAAVAIATAIDANLLVRESSSHVWFRQGLADDVKPLDTQALGILYLAERCASADVPRVRNTLTRDFAVSGRSIAKSTDVASFNGLYAASGPFSGYRPYAATDAPDVLWTEGTFEARLALEVAGVSTSTLDSSLARWAALTPGKGALGADRTVTSSAYNEYHVWPTSAAGSWQLLALDAASVLRPVAACA